MLKLLLMFNLVLLIFHVGSHSIPHSPISVEGYYWREYAGSVPFDALIGGRDYNNKPIYIGQVLYENALVVGKIYESDNKIHYGYIAAKTATKHVKILCTQTPEKFDWIKTNNSSIQLLTDRHFILGGVEPGCILYVGRIHHHFETTPGKIIIPHTGQPGTLHISNNDKEIGFSSFEILVYNI